jgi:hypothetical protein
MNWQYYLGRKHERNTIKKDLIKLIQEKKTKTEIVDYIRKNYLKDDVVVITT